MTLILTLNAILCLAVLVLVVSPLAWAALTQNRDTPSGPARTNRDGSTATPDRHRPYRYDPAASALR